MKQFDRTKLNIMSLSERESKSDLSILINPNSQPPNISQKQLSGLERIAISMKKARQNNAPIVFAFGAHLIKNGLSRILIELMRKEYVQHLLSNEAVVIHDWGLAFQGRTEEDVKRYVAEGQFGLWETGEHIGDAIKQGAENNLGYGESIGKLISKSSYPHKDISVLCQACKLNIPFSVGVSLGQNITHMHPKFDFEAVGKAGGIDFLKFVETISNLEGGVYISIGSAITSPMIFEKAMSMARNVALQGRNSLEDFDIVVNDIQSGDWDWSQSEPPKDNPAYYLRFMKTFSRMPGRLEYVQLDNRSFLHNLYYLLIK